jgi:hypothetical protein
MNKRWQIALHEAAHAVFDRERGFSIECVSLGDCEHRFFGGAKRAHVKARPSEQASKGSEHRRIYEEVMVALVGYGAMEQLGGKSDEREGDQDLQEAKRHCGLAAEHLAGRTPEDLLAEVRPVAAGFVREHEKQITALAEALLREPKGFLTGEQVEALLGGTEGAASFPGKITTPRATVLHLVGQELIDGGPVES